jgi:hypothetical protein
MNGLFIVCGKEVKEMIKLDSYACILVILKQKSVASYMHKIYCAHFRLLTIFQNAFSKIQLT